MTLDEAIIREKELSASQSVCKDCREEHKQLAAWLEELKQYKEKNQPEKIAKEMFEELGYMFIKTSVSIFYINASDDEYKNVEFYYSDHTFRVADDYNVPVRIGSALFEAIQQQMKELGWI